MSEEENDNVYTPPQQQNNSIAEGDIVICANKNYENFGIWGEVVDITEEDGILMAAIKIANPEFPRQTGWIVKEKVDNLELA